MSLTHPESGSFCCWVRVRAKGDRPSLKVLPISAHALVEVHVQRTGQPRDLESKKHFLSLFAAKSMLASKEVSTKKALVSATLCALLLPMITRPWGFDRNTPDSVYWELVKHPTCRVAGLQFDLTVGNHCCWSTLTKICQDVVPYPSCICEILDVFPLHQLSQPLTSDFETSCWVCT